MTRGAGRTCPSCGALNKPKWEFCARCGEPLTGDAPAAGAARAPAPSAGRRTEPDEGISFPWKTVLVLALAGGAIWASFKVRGAGTPSGGESTFVMPTVPSAAPAATSAVPTSEGEKHLAEGRRLLAAG